MPKNPLSAKQRRMRSYLQRAAAHDLKQPAILHLRTLHDRAASGLKPGQAWALLEDVAADGQNPYELAARKIVSAATSGELLRAVDDAFAFGFHVGRHPLLLELEAIRADAHAGRAARLGGKTPPRPGVKPRGRPPKVSDAEFLKPAEHSVPLIRQTDSTRIKKGHKKKT